MKTVGIICECNPFHAGHRQLISFAKSRGECTLVALMSGAFVQRGSPAVLDPHNRAKMLLEGGADLVLELPFPYSSGSAEYFAGAGIKILTMLGVDELLFGSECGDVEFLKKQAKVCSSKTFLSRYRELCKSGVGSAAAFRSALQACGTEENPMDFGANDLLGISYLRAIQQQKSKLLPVTLKREGSAYDDENLNASVPSATALRKAWMQSGLEAVRTYFSPTAFDILQSAEAERTAPVSEEFLYRFAFERFRIEPAKHWDKIAELETGLGRRIAEAAKSSGNAAEFQTSLGAKLYTDARIRRGLLFSLTGITKKDLKSEIGYVLMLGANERGRAFLGKQRKEKSLPIVTSVAKIPKTEAAALQKEREERAEALYTLCLPQPRPAGFFLRKSPILVSSQNCNTCKEKK